MPDRILRYGITDSERLASLHDKTYRLWTHLIIGADDFGLVPIDYGHIKALTPLLDWTREMVSKMLEELIDCGLILPYEAGGKRYAAMDKFRAFVNCEHPKHPIPTFGMGHLLRPSRFKDKKTRISASKFFNHINDNVSDRDPLVDHECPTSDPLVDEGVRGKREEVRESTNTITVNKEPIVGRKEKNAPDACLTEPKEKTKTAKEIAVSVLDLLNRRTGRNYRPVPANVDLIVARLKEGATEEECRWVVAKKCRDWIDDPRMSVYLRPATLFNKTKFAQYRGEVGNDE